jgi:hypothetical protein
MPSFNSTPVTLNQPATLTYDAPVAGWVFGSRSLLRSGSSVVPPESLNSSFQIGSVAIGPTGATAPLTFTGTWWRWLLIFVAGTYSLVLKIRPEPQAPELTAVVPLAWQLSVALMLGQSVSLKPSAPANQSQSCNREETGACAEFERG